MSSIIPNEEYRELLLKQQLLSLKVMVGIFFIIGLPMVVGAFAMQASGEDEGFLVLLIIGSLMVLLSIIVFIVQNKSKSKTFEPYYYQKFVAYETEGTKVPLYRVVSNGKSSQIIYMLLDIEEENYKLFDIQRKGVKLYFEAKASNAYVKFFYKIKNGLEVMKPKILFVVNGKKKYVYGNVEVNDIFLGFLKNAGLKYELQIGRNKELIER
ncbi:MAG: hypothetical protein JEZ05_03460 [Tenericutes bacterium]|nr:hypothetical protein [Mycoplasmatota bacterium]